MKLRDFTTYLMEGRSCSTKTELRNIMLESNDYIPELNLGAGNFISTNPLELDDVILDKEVIGISAYNNQVVFIIN